MKHRVWPSRNKATSRRRRRAAPLQRFLQELERIVERLGRRRQLRLQPRTTAAAEARSDGTAPVSYARGSQLLRRLMRSAVLVVGNLPARENPLVAPICPANGVKVLSPPLNPSSPTGPFRSSTSADMRPGPHLTPARPRRARRHVMPRQCRQRLDHTNYRAQLRRPQGLDSRWAKVMLGHSGM